jgi:diphthamide biosynthesis protein 7
MPSIEHLQSITLDLPPSCVEFCPDHPQYAVIGTYNLEKQDEHEHEIEEGGGQRKTQQRSGSLILQQIQGDNVYALANRLDF